MTLLALRSALGMDGSAKAPTPWIADVSFATTNTSGGVTVAKPGTTQNGDLLVAIHTQDPDTQTGSTGPNAMTAPAGWAQTGASQILTGAGNMKVWQKTASSEGASYVFGSVAGSDTNVTIIRIANPGSITVVPSFGGSATQSVSHVAPTVTPNSANSLVIYAWYALNLNATSTGYVMPAGVVKVSDNPGTSEKPYIRAAVGQVIEQPSGVAMGTKTATHGPTTSWLAMAMVVSAPISFTTYQGAVSMAASATLTSNAIQTRFAAVAMAATATLTSDGVRSTTGAVSMAATATLTTASPAIATSGAVSLTPSATLTANGIRSTTGAVSMAPSATLTANGVSTQSGAVALAPSATLAVNGTVTPAIQAAVSMSASASLTANGAVSTTLQGAVSLSAITTLTANAVQTRFGQVTMNAAATWSVTALQTMVGAVSMAASATLATDGVRTTSGAVSMSASATLTAVASQTMQAAISLSAVATLTANALQTRFGAVALSPTYTLTVSTTKQTTGQVSMAASATFSAQIGATTGSVSMTVGKTLTVAGTRISSANVSMTTTVTLTVAGIRTTFGNVSLTPVVTLTFAGTQTRFGLVSLVPDVVTSVNGIDVTFGLVSMAVAPAMTAAFISFIVPRRMYAEISTLRNYAVNIDTAKQWAADLIDTHNERADVTTIQRSADVSVQEIYANAVVPDTHGGTVSTVPLSGSIVED